MGCVEAVKCERQVKEKRNWIHGLLRSEFLLRSKEMMWM